MKKLILLGFLLALPFQFTAASTFQEKPLLEPTDFTLITNPELFRPLERLNGFSLGSLISNDAEKFVKASNADLLKIPAYASVIQAIKADLIQIDNSDDILGIGMSHSRRLFDYSHFDITLARFALMGIVPRFDRAYVKANSCGEVRFVYRLAYNISHNGIDVQSRLPITINLVFYVRDPNTPLPQGVTIQQACQKYAARWIGPHGKPFANGTPNEEVYKYLASETGPLNRNIFGTNQLKSMEFNLQSVRWPASIKSDFGGYSQYHFRVYRWETERQVFVKSPLENQIDISKLKTNTEAGKALRAKLLAYLKQPQVLAQIDSGTLNLPDEFLAHFGTLVTPQGLNRIQNRAFLKVFSEKDFSGIAFDNFKYIKSPQALLRKLDQQTCTGCHSTRSAAGFHFFGQNLETAFAGNAVFIPVSPHILSDVPRRRNYIETLAAGNQPTPAKGFAERADLSGLASKPYGITASGLVSGWSAACSMGKDPSFKNWTCAPGYKCAKLTTSDNAPSDIGTCVPATGHQIGDSCETGKVSVNANTPTDPRTDTLATTSNHGCGGGVLSCVAESGGFPGGMCAMKDCNGIPKFGACGVLPTSKPGFNPCLASGKNFVQCIQEFKTGRGLRACNTMNPCRDDYLCALSVEQDQMGVCVPPYFLFQFRVDGHPLAS